MRLLDWWIVRELIPPLLFGVGLFTTLVFAGGYVFMITEYAVKGAPLPLVLELALLYLPQIAVRTLPMGMLLATLLGFGRLSSDWEVTAARAAGISLRRMMLPVFVLGLGVSLAAIAFNETLVPQATERAARIRRAILEQLRLTEQQVFGFPQYREGRLDSYIIVAGGRDPQTQELYQVTLLKYSTGSQREPEVVLYAERAQWDGVNQWTLHNGWWRTAQGQYGSFVRFRSEPTLNVAIRRTPVQIEALLTNADARSFRQLREQIEYYRREGADPAQVRQLTVELYNKINIPLASVVFALLGAPLGVRPQRSSPATGFALSVAIIFAYWVMVRYLAILGRGVIDPLLASSLPNLIGAALALWLIHKRESAA
ncbi:MAG: LptF/LptG family permease [Armatimonadota bacterium]|nr:LptF/LptG family permease [Armatimonadota bacterium]